MNTHAPTLPAWPPHAAEAQWRMLSVETEVLIGAEPAAVHAYATNASRWGEWHPATREVVDVPDRPLGLGETIVERIAAAGRHFTAAWTVIGCDTPGLWVIATDSTEGIARITYRLAAERGADGSTGTRFHRRLEFRSKGRLLRWLDPLVRRWVLAPQSQRALQRLKGRIETR